MFLLVFFLQIVAGNTPLVMYSNSNQNNNIQTEKRFTLQLLQLNHSIDTGIAYVLCDYIAFKLFGTLQTFLPESKSAAEPFKLLWFQSQHFVAEPFKLFG